MKPRQPLSPPLSAPPDPHAATPNSRQEICAGFLAGIAGAMLAPGCAAAPAPRPNSPAPQPAIAGPLDLRQPPDFVRAFPEKQALVLAPAGTGVWENQGVTVRARPVDGAVRFSVAAPQTPLLRLQFRWRGTLAAGLRVMNDHWERAYGDLEWRGLHPNRVLPWYFLTCDGQRTHGYGVKVRPNACCFWNVDEQGVSLWLDVRNGGSAVRLGGRELTLCDVIVRPGREGESPFAAAREFCRAMCPDPLWPETPILGTNDWYYSYGNSQPEEILRVTDRVVALAPRAPHRMFSLIDGGWAPGGSDRGPWDQAKERFGDMAGFAAKLRTSGAEPGIWFRPLGAPTGSPVTLRLSRDARFFDPSTPEVLARVAEDTRRFRAWGYTMIKHDFSSFDLFGRWGFDMGAQFTNDGWSFADRTRTSAEIVLALYRTLRDAAGATLLIGCNTFSHLSAGLFELNRIGDDVSGRAWDRTRRMGVNTLAFRAAHHRTFYAADPDIAVITRDHPWELGRHWLRLMAASGMPLFVSPQLSELGPAQAAALKDAFALSVSQPPPTAEPLDWLETSCPRRWRLGTGQLANFDWISPEGPWPFKD